MRSNGVGLTKCSAPTAIIATPVAAIAIEAARDEGACRVIASPVRAPTAIGFVNSCSKRARRSFGDAVDHRDGSVTTQAPSRSRRSTSACNASLVRQKRSPHRAQ